MVKIIIPNKYINEIQYTFDILFESFLGLSINYEISDENPENFIVILNNGKKIILSNLFFSIYDEPNGYLKIDNVPNSITKINTPFNKEKDLPIIFGTGAIDIREEMIKSDSDIIASTFFMLTRWEEYVHEEKDRHFRFSAEHSLAYKEGFLDRPVVNEYLEMLWNMITRLDPSVIRKTRGFTMKVTHDVDSIRYLRNYKDLVRSIGGDLLIRKDVKAALRRFSEFWNLKKGKINDPYNTFDWMMDLSESANLKSEFYFMSGGKTKYDNRYRISDEISINLINDIIKRNHIIGFHPSYDTYNNQELFNEELNNLQKYSSQTVSGGRQHYLRFSLPETWQIWENAGMKYDSTLSYADESGFRCGTCYEYNVFNILTRQKLKLIERPLIVMEVTLASYKKMSPKHMSEEIQRLKEICEIYHGTFTVLWHNSNFNTRFWDEYKEVYINLLESHR